MALRILSVILVVVAALLIFAAAKPNLFRIQRAIEIQASPERIFTLLNDFHNWSRWSPQDKEDSTMHRTYSGSPDGVGAVSDWESRDRAGKGRMSITESVPPTRISIKVDFVKPFETQNINEFALEPAAGAIKVTWTMHGPNLYVMKLMGIFVSMHRMMGRHFETGLNNLKTAAED